MYCYHCGLNAPDDASFCPRCGAWLGRARAPKKGMQSALAVGRIVGFVLIGLLVVAGIIAALRWLNGGLDALPSLAVSKEPSQSTHMQGPHKSYVSFVRATAATQTNSSATDKTGPILCNKDKAKSLENVGQRANQNANQHLAQDDFGIAGSIWEQCSQRDAEPIKSHDKVMAGDDFTAEAIDDQRLGFGGIESHAWDRSQTLLTEAIKRGYVSPQSPDANVLRQDLEYAAETTGNQEDIRAIDDLE